VAAIDLDGVTATYPGGHAAVRNVTLRIDEGEFFVLVGPSGCGKSTLLRLIAGLETPESGRVRIGGTDVTAMPPQARDVAMVFQSYALYPHMAVRDNLSYALRVRRMEPAAIAARVAAVAGALGLDDLLDRRPAQLSGGQRQRVALGRALVREPKAFLLDEPLSNLDPALRAQARAELRRLHETTGTTTVYVTHDQEEAMTLGARVAVMRDGAIEQTAAPRELYARPQNVFVARFIGAPAMNLLPAVLAVAGAPEGALAGVRPHDVRIDPDGRLQAVVELVEPRGPDTVVHLRLAADGDPRVVAVVAGDAPPPGAPVSLTVPPDRLHLFAGHSGIRLD
jgi:ABC-type sugar transport system ATPase subunit